MLDRQDIDALLMGALYGELSPDESTRLEEHLSAHPQDKIVLDGLSRARQAVKDSLILARQAEPPAAVSALLMQEAARRAPAPREQRVGWFAKLVAVMRHPAVAAVTVVVLIAAVGGTIYLKNGDRGVVEREVASKQEAQAPATTAAATPSAGSGSAAVVDEGAAIGETGNGSGYVADLQTTDGHADTNGKTVANETDKGVAPGGTEPKRPRKGKDYIEVHTPGPMVKDPDTGESIDTEKRQVAKNADVDVKPTTPPPPPAEPGRDRGKTGAKTTTTVIVPGDDRADTSIGLSGDIDSTTAGAGAGAGQGGYGTATGSTATAPQYSSAGASAGGSTTPPDPTAAAKGLHTRLIGLVKANKCTEASKVALDLYARYPDYYNQFVANDRKVKACKPYIDNARRKKNDAAKKAAKDQPQEVSPAPDSMKISE